MTTAALQQDSPTLAHRWLYALKPASWPKLVVPTLLGQALGVTASGTFSPAALLFGMLFVVADTVAIVMLNDWGDQSVDRLKRQMFPDGCSAKTIPDGILAARSVLNAGLAAAIVASGLALGFGYWLQRPFLAPAGLLALLLFAAYTLPPLRLNYRGGGELLEALGVGLLLPWLNAYAQSGLPFNPRYLLLAGAVALSLSSALASGLSDEQSDRAGGKRTFTTMLCNHWVRRATEISLFVGPLLWLSVSLLTSVQLAVRLLIPATLAAGVVYWHTWKLILISDRATTNAFRDQSRYKSRLHRAIWFGMSVLALTLLITEKTL